MHGVRILTNRIARVTTFVSVAAITLAASALVSASPVAMFESDLQPTTPASGWQYLRNSSGPVGNPANYSPLQATTHPNVMYDDDGDAVLNDAEPGRYSYIGRSETGLGLVNEGEPGGHPGGGASQDSLGIERFIIAAYTLSVSGDTSITNSLLTNSDVSTDGLNLRVYVNAESSPRLSTSTAAGQGQTATFDVTLGALSAGDTIYVAIGSHLEDFRDTFSLEYTIDVVPEPASVALLVAGCAWLARRVER